MRGPENQKPGQPKPTGVISPTSECCSAPDVKRPAETGIDSRSLPSDPLTGVSSSSTASPPTAPGQSDGEAIRACPVASHNPNAGWRGAETPHWLPSDALSVLLASSIPYWAI